MPGCFYKNNFPKLPQKYDRFGYPRISNPIPNIDSWFQTVKLTESQTEELKKNRICRSVCSKEGIAREFIMNSKPVPDTVLKAYEYFLKNTYREKDLYSINPSCKHSILVTRADITTFRIDCIVNPANADGLGCFNPTHTCLDNIIHRGAGPRLRMLCQEKLKGRKLGTVVPMITSGCCLPAKYVIHVAGPIWDPKAAPTCIQQLKDCYTKSLQLAVENGADVIAFPCISTGLYGFPNKLATQIAISSVMKWKKSTSHKIKVIFCTFKDIDMKLYQDMFTLVRSPSNSS